MIYTSYFAKLKSITNPISICGKAPDFYTGYQYKKLAPQYDFFMEYKEGIKNSHSDNDRKQCEEKYVYQYYTRVLHNLDPAVVVKELSEFYHSDTFTLLCFEKPSDFCHRHLVADWLIASGYSVEEIVW